MSGPLLRDASVVFQDGRVAAVGPTVHLRRDFPDAEHRDAGNSIILPGLVNAHVHLELSSLTCGDRTASFVDWLMGLMKQSGGSLQQSVDNGMRNGIAQCLRFGVTSVGDITSQPKLSRPILSSSPIGGVSYGEVRAMASRRGFLDERLAAAAEPIIGSERLIAGITPHAPYSIETTGYKKCLEVAKACQLPLATHLAETIAEASFLADHTGPFRDLWALLAAWDDNVPTSKGGPIKMAESIGLLDYPTLFAHVNFADDQELAILARGKASVVYCPRTHAYFDHPPHRWREMLAAGINVAVGTDSCASSPDLNLVDDLRLLHRIAPEVPPQQLWEMATLRAAVAINRPDIGSLTPGNAADAVVFAISGGKPLLEILECDRLLKEVWTAGERMNDELF
jgi:cytosine/adenosine deaminase-related metal-dependent hydrolase